ncbi:MAG: DUF4430 domain-containing protein [Halanaerobiales bacterium]
MNKKVLSIIIVLLLAVTLFYGYNKFLAPEGVEGEKEIGLEISIEKQDINEGFIYNTDYEFLYGLLKEKEDELGISFEETEYGAMLIEVMDYKAQSDNQEFFHIEVNGESAQYGVEEIALNDGDQIKLELTKW